MNPGLIKMNIVSFCGCLRVIRTSYKKRSTSGKWEVKLPVLSQLTLLFPAFLAGAPEGEIRLHGLIERCRELSYQILDDLKNVLQSAEESGKMVSRDLSFDRPNIALVSRISAGHATPCTPRSRRADPSPSFGTTTGSPVL